MVPARQTPLGYPGYLLDASLSGDLQYRFLCITFLNVS